MYNGVTIQRQCRAHRRAGGLAGSDTFVWQSIPGSGSVFRRGCEARGCAAYARYVVTHVNGRRVRACLTHSGLSEPDDMARSVTDLEHAATLRDRIMGAVLTGWEEAPRAA